MDAKTRRSEELAERLAALAGDGLLAVARLPDSRPGRHVADQLTRSVTAPGAHYAEARSAQSHADFVHKLGLAAKEAREAQHWLRTSIRTGWLTEAQTLLCECGEVAAILGAAVQTARRNRSSR